MPKISDKRSDKLSAVSKPQESRPVTLWGAALQPDPFLEVRVRRLDLSPTLRGLCVGYEGGKWRTQQFVDHILEWLPEFALSENELNNAGHHLWVSLLRRAAKVVYTSPKYASRGEFGELLLHIILRQDCETIPAISKVYFKSATNETVHGFDGVHVVNGSDGLELWLGEAKFHKHISTAIREVTAELANHIQHDYLRREFLLIGNKLDNSRPFASQLQKLIHRNRSLDLVFKRLCFPVLLTYDSSCVAKHTICDAEYQAAFEAEIEKHHEALINKGLPANIRVHLMLLPLLDKEQLTTCLDKELKAWQ
jgi:hypothetical protein